MSITSSSVLVEMNISVWTANKLDKSATDKVVADNAAVVIKELFPVPRAPVSSTLFAGFPSTNCRVFASTSRFC